jgi:hypothetical protein
MVGGCGCAYVPCGCDLLHRDWGTLDRLTHEQWQCEDFVTSESSVAR